MTGKPQDQDEARRPPEPRRPRKPTGLTPSRVKKAKVEAGGDDGVAGLLLSAEYR